MSAPMAHMQNWLKTHSGDNPNVWPHVPPEHLEMVERAMYFWTHAVRQDLENRDMPGDRIVADFLMDMQAGNGYLPHPVDFNEAVSIASALHAGVVESQIDGEVYEPLSKRLLGGKQWRDE